MIGFDRPVAPGGYAWWYVDALSDDRRHGIALIAFVGSVFSPYYAMARRRGIADPADHVALNVALYGGVRRWAMTERGRRRLDARAATLAIGPSALDWRGDTLHIDIDEVTVPLPSRLRGTIRVFPTAVAQRQYGLDAAGRHRWRPLAPCARIEVSLRQPALEWRGTAYLDSNDGDEPLEDEFAAWTWSRSCRDNGETVVLFDVTGRRAPAASLALRFDSSGAVEPFAAPPVVPLTRSGWRIDRATRSDDDRAGVIRSLEDAPFYARSLVSSTLRGEPSLAMHESLDLDRFRAPWVQAMLPFRMPRRG